MLTIFRKIFLKKNEVNYLYFGFLLLFLASLSLSHYLSWEQPLSGISLFFFFYAIGQALVEVSIFVLIAHLLKRWAPSWSYFLFISFSFIFLLLHFTDFTLVRLMDASISYLFKFLFGSGVEHLIAGLQALNMNMTMVAIIIFASLSIPLMGLGFYWMTSRIARLKPLHISLLQITIALGSISLSLLLFDLIAHPFLNSYSYNKYQKSLPFGTTFISPTPQFVTLPSPILEARNEKETLSHLPLISLQSKPNIYFFVIETLRKDFVDLEIAPHLTAFGKENIQFQRSFSNANATHCSWFSIFHSNFPFHWAAMRDEWKGGSIPLQFLKRLGYKISVYSSADLRYFNMDRLLFGTRRELAETIEEYTFDRNIEPCDRDRLALKALQKRLQTEEGREGNVYLIFLDSTHSEYSFPKDFPLKFKPISKEIDYLTIGPKSPELEQIKNRYRNSIHYIDCLMGDFFSNLKEKNLFCDAIISITGDHGEEFFEEGALFHGTHLNSYQTSVPIFMKFPSKDWIPQTEEASHMDLFPSILHYLTGKCQFADLFDGESIFSENRWPYRIAVSQNGSLPPVEFSIEQGNTKFHARFPDTTKANKQLNIEMIQAEGIFDPSILAPLIENGTKR